MTDVPDAPIPLAAASAAWASAPAPDSAPPSAEPVAPADPIPAPEGASPETPAPGTEPAPEAAAPPAGQPRDEAGRFVAPPPTIEAKLGDAVVPLRADALVPVKRGDAVEYQPLADVLARQADVETRLRETAGRQRATAQAEARLRAREEALAAREAELKGAATDPAKFEAYTEHLRQYQENPAYRQMVDRALEADALKADLAARQAEEADTRIHEAVTTASQWIDAAVARHPGVNAERVRTLYGQALAANMARFDPADVERIVESEAQALTAGLTPLQTQLAEIKAELDRVKAEALAAKQNATTAHALGRAGTIPTAPAGRPPAPGPRVLETADGRRDLASLTEAWKKSA